jgi:hypothetical protein
LGSTAFYLFLLQERFFPIHYKKQLLHQGKMIEKPTTKKKAFLPGSNDRKSPNWKEFTWLLKQWKSNFHANIYYFLLNSSKARLDSSKARLETLENSQPILSPLKPIKNKVKREVVQFYVARQAAALKNAVHCNCI